MPNNSPRSPASALVAGIDTRPEQLAAFRATHNIPHGFASVQDAITEGEFDAVTNVTPDAAHHATTMPFLAAGKHVLCEKPLATNAADAQEMAEAAAKASVVNMVNLTYRNVPALQQAARMVREGIGEIRHFEASYLQSWLTQPAWGHWDKEPQWLWRLSTGTDQKASWAMWASTSSTSRPSSRAWRDADFLPLAGLRPRRRAGRSAKYSRRLLSAMALADQRLQHAVRLRSGHLNDLRLRLRSDRRAGGAVREERKPSARLPRGRGDEGRPLARGGLPARAHDLSALHRRDPGRRSMEPDFRPVQHFQVLLDKAEASAAQDGRLLAV